MNHLVCRHCGQPLKTRHGVALSPMRLRVLDIIEQRPGVTSAHLSAVLYPGVELKKARRTLFSHLVHLNSALESTDVRVVKLGGGYRVMRALDPTEVEWRNGGVRCP